MYSLASNLKRRPVVSLQTGQIVAWASEPVLELSTLEVIALICQSGATKNPVLLMSRDIRQYAPDCIIVDNEDELTNPEDIVRLNSNPKKNYSPIGKPVVEESGHKLGTVENYTINLETNRVQKLHVRKSLFQSLFGSGLIIDRTQITDITPDHIIVRDTSITNRILTPDSIPET